MGQYAGAQLADAKTFAASVAAALQTCPADRLEELIRALPRKYKFMPSIKEICDAIDEIKRPRLHARRVAQAHLAENQSRDDRARGKMWKDFSDAEKEQFNQWSAQKARAHAKPLGDFLDGVIPDRDR